MNRTLAACAPALFVLCACGGQSFDIAPTLDSGTDTAPQTPEPMAGTPDARSEAKPLGADAGSDTGSSPDTFGPCGELRSDDSMMFDRETCYPETAFTMGSLEPNLGNGFADHTPARSVTLDAFVLDAYEVTVARYRRCVDDGGCPAPGSDLAKGCTFETGEDYPVTCVSWAEAREFCRWDGDRRLPTEAEWEAAARGTDERAYPWGNDFQCELAVLGGTAACPEHDGVAPARVASRPEGASPEVAFDLSGNVAEWVFDWVGSYSSADVSNPTGPDTGSQKSLRGGSWRSVPPAGMAYVRSPASPEVSTGAVGFRCARSP